VNDFNPPPIPDPFQVPTPPTLAERDWKNAPPVIKNWAYPLTWLGIIALPLVMLFPFIDTHESHDRGELIAMTTAYGVALAITVWLNRGLKKGTPAAWTVQFISSILGLCGFPLGTIINGYILSKWSKPEVKAWFGMS
jgi:hypothetical protein